MYVLACSTDRSMGVPLFRMTAVWLGILLCQRASGEAELTLLATRSSDGWSDTFCAVYDTEWGHVPSTHHPVTWFPAQEATDDPPFSCSPQLPPGADGAGGVAIVALRGRCTICEKASYVERVNGSVLIVVNQSDWLVNPVDQCYRSDYTPTIPVLLVSNETGYHILAALWQANITVAPYTPPLVLIDPAAGITMIVAIATVILGSYFANRPFEFMRYGLLNRRGENYEPDQQQQSGGGEVKKGLKAIGIILFGIFIFLLICSTLVLLYYFYYPMVYLVIAVYSIGVTIATYSLLSPFVALIPFLKNVRLPANRLPILKYRPDPRFAATLLLCVSLTATWLVVRNSQYGWLLHNLLGFALVTYIFSSTLCFSTRVVAIAMIVFFFYDIIMVFITPYMTESHDSVMVKVATGGSIDVEPQHGSSNAEPLPIVFQVPNLLTSELEKRCSELLANYWPYSLLGYGDASVPGLLVARCLHFDLAHKPHSFRGKLRPYFTVAGLAYSVGLVVTYVALFLMKRPQPALLYLVPITLGSVTLTSLFRRQFFLFFTGKPRKKITNRGCGQTEELPVAMHTQTDNEEGDCSETCIDQSNCENQTYNEQSDSERETLIGDSGDN